MNRVTTFLNSLGRSTRVLILALAITVGSAGIAQAATIISTNILTGGTLGVLGVSTFGATASTTISAAGVLTAPSAIVNGTLAAYGATTFGGTATSTFGADGTVTLTAGLTGTTATLSGLASTSALKVGDEPAAPTINGMVFGYCSFGDTVITSSTTEGFASCTTVPAGALLAGDRVFVQATSSFDAPFIITAASTTGVSTIQLRIMNTGIGAADGTLGGTSVNFWALR